MIFTFYLKEYAKLWLHVLMVQIVPVIQLQERILVNVRLVFRELTANEVINQRVFEFSLSKKKIQNSVCKPSQNPENSPKEIFISF